MFTALRALIERNDSGAGTAVDTFESKRVVAISCSRISLDTLIVLDLVLDVDGFRVRGGQLHPAVDRIRGHADDLALGCTPAQRATRRGAVGGQLRIQLVE